MTITEEAVRRGRRPLVSQYDPRALYRQAADILRDRVTGGRYLPGERLPAETILATEFGVRIEVFRRAVALLRTEGLLDYGPPGRRKRVRQQPARKRLTLRPDTEVTIRMPAPDERDAFNVADGVPVFVVGTTIYPGDRYALRAERPSDRQLRATATRSHQRVRATNRGSA